MTRGNQRELARAKAAKRQDPKKNKVDDGLSLDERRQRDADIMRQKQAKKQAQKEQASSEKGAVGGKK